MTTPDSVTIDGHTTNGQPTEPPTERCPECGDGESDFEDSALICPTCGGDGDGW